MLAVTTCGFNRRAKPADTDRPRKYGDRLDRRMIGKLDFLRHGQTYDNK
jgi:hypothetical protein